MSAKNSPPEPHFRSIVLTLPPGRIALFKSIVESHDNLATLRTEDRHRHLLRLYFAPEREEEVNEMLAALADEFALRRL
jgi:hypothetical protein